MFQLILTVMAIALTSALVMVSINYLPAWRGAARDVEQQVRTALPQLEEAYDAATRAAGGVPPAVLAASDGGFSAQFLPLLRFAPAAPAGYVWTYGQHGDDGSRYANLNYFCLAPTRAGLQGVGRGLYRGVSAFSRDQAFVNTSCGATVTQAAPSNWNAAPARAVTFYVAYTPGVNR
ncbi:MULTISPECIES: hypothetical protein [unclassified Variovorax]|uniref:hypothetical protein n=1 Tax=unclassified Variovorax TaxID=663243 RepID=UPI001318488D|nr:MULTISPECIES: hypothetical protein [unclassified Variovorax]VTU41908.1 hypothetical protein H6P1_00070 [Variovorax sp. PBL-H6]VTU44439.1 hypothetical protein SRS16P1_00832 [Variovorax sp. SRS16]VTU44482.1 hypothetical protein E5P1_00825 [Variovorax sp. PBL-E5]